jgi:hypothetical protein
MSKIIAVNEMEMFIKDEGIQAQIAALRSCLNDKQQVEFKKYIENIKNGFLYEYQDVLAPSLKTYQDLIDKVFS